MVFSSLISRERTLRSNQCPYQSLKKNSNGHVWVILPPVANSMIPGGWCILDSLVKLPNTLELNMKVRDCQPLQVEKGNSPNEKDFEQTNKITYIYDIHSVLFWGIKHSFAEGLTLLLTLTNNKKSKTQNMSEHLAISKYKCIAGFRRYINRGEV